MERDTPPPMFRVRVDQDDLPLTLVETLVHGFINSITNLFPQDQVLGEHFWQLALKNALACLQIEAFGLSRSKR